MGYYDLSAAERKKLYTQMQKDLVSDLSSGNAVHIKEYSSDTDTYIRKNCYLILGRLFNADKKIRESILSNLDRLSLEDDEKIRQTVVYALGEIGKQDFDVIRKRLEVFLHDTHHVVKNGLTGALKQMGEKNPGPVLQWAKSVIKICNKDMRKYILHGLELRGRTHPEDLLPIIRETLQGPVDQTTRKMLIHIIGQISYKEGCLEKVAAELKTWEDKSLISDCKKEIIDVHKRYEKFSAFSAEEAAEYMNLAFTKTTERKE
jgi:hypothetical protein